MARIEKSVFISYRRTNAAWTLAIYQYLTRHGYDVFYDIAGLGSGDFETVIVENIRARPHFLIVLTPSALECCNEPGDWLRREIETALDSKRNIVALMLDEFKFNAPGIGEQLTGKLAALRKYNALHVPSDYFEAAMERLRNQFLNVPVDAVPHPVSPAVQKAAEAQQEQANAAQPASPEELTAEQWYERARQADKQDDKIRLYTEAIRLKPDYAFAYNNRGVARYANGDLDGAIRDFSDSLRLVPEDGEIFYNRGVARHGKGDFEGAIQDYDEAIRLNPRSAAALNNRGVTRSAKGDLDDAIRDYDDSLRLAPDDAEVFYNRGVARHGKDDLEGAIGDYDAAIRLKPDYGFAFFNRANARKGKGDLDGAIQDYDEAVRLLPDDPDAFHNRGNARKDKGNLDGAIRDFDEAIRLKPDYASAFYNRGLARKAKGDSESAETDFAEARRLGWEES